MPTPRNLANYGGIDEALCEALARRPLRPALVADILAAADAWERSGGAEAETERLRAAVVATRGEAMKPNSKTRARRLVSDKDGGLLLDFDGDCSFWMDAGRFPETARLWLVDALAREFRAVRRQALLSAARAIEAKERTWQTAAAKHGKGNDVAAIGNYCQGLAKAAAAIREMAKPKRRKA